MDTEGFDRLTAVLVSVCSRRTLLATLTAVLAGFLGLSGLADLDDDLGVEANRRRRGKGKGKRKKGKNRRENQKERCTTDADCPTPHTCDTANGKCVCSHDCCSDSDCPPDQICDNFFGRFICSPGP